MKKSLGKSDSICADMAELADAHGSGPCRSNSVEVRILLSAPHSKVSKNRDLVLFFDSDRVSAPKSGYLGSCFVIFDFFSGFDNIFCYKQAL